MRLLTDHLKHGLAGSFSRVLVDNCHQFVSTKRVTELSDRERKERIYEHMPKIPLMVKLSMFTKAHYWNRHGWCFHSQPNHLVQRSGLLCLLGDPYEIIDISGLMWSHMSNYFAYDWPRRTTGIPYQWSLGELVANDMGMCCWCDWFKQPVIKMKTAFFLTFVGEEAHIRRLLFFCW